MHLYLLVRGIELHYSAAETRLYYFVGGHSFTCKIINIFDSYTVSNHFMLFTCMQVDWEHVMNELKAIKGVEEVHDLHIWSISSKSTSLTVHIRVSDVALLVLQLYVIVLFVSCHIRHMNRRVCCALLTRCVSSWVLTTPQFRCRMQLTRPSASLSFVIHTTQPRRRPDHRACCQTIWRYQVLPRTKLW